MQVSRIEIFGFKSFMERLALPLEGGITGVVGPNGCGKSNIVDAIRWVLGETRARTLRGGTLEDVIFNGSDNLRPLGLAEVTVTLRAQSDNFFADLASQSSEADKLAETAAEEIDLEAELEPDDLLSHTNTSNDNDSDVDVSDIERTSSDSRPHLRVIAGNLGKTKDERLSAIAAADTATTTSSIVSTSLADHYSWLKGANEVQITRRLYRSGESEYFINRVSCRLKDLKELFRAVGLGPRSYTIVAQGEVSRIISARPEERRVILEEAAGVQGFRDKIAASNRRLEETDVNISRLVDIIKEIERQVASLKRQAARAQNRQSLKQEIFELDRQLFSDGLSRLRVRTSEVQKELVALKDVEQQLESSFQSLRTAEESKRNELLAIDVQGDTLRSGIDAIKEELNERLRQRSDRQARLSELEAYRKARVTEIARLEERKSQLSIRQTECDQSLTALRSQESELLEQLQTLDMSAANRLTELAKERDALKQQVKDSQVTVRTEREALVASQSSLSALEQQLVAASPINQLKQTLNDEDLGQLNQLTQQCNLLIDGLSVPEKYAKAVQSVLGERAAFLVASDPHRIARAFIENSNKLDKPGLGLGVLRQQVTAISRPNTTGYPAMTSVITVNHELNSLVSQLLSDVYVCDTCQQAFEFFENHSDSPVTFVALSGEVVSANSFYSFKHEAGLVQLKQKADSLHVQLRNHQEVCTTAEEKLNTLQMQLDSVESAYAVTVEEVQTRQAQANLLNSDLGSVRGRLQAEGRMVTQVEQDHANLAKQFADAETRIKEYEQDLQNVKEEIDAMQPTDEETLHSRLRALQEEYQKLDENRIIQRKELSVIATQVAEERNAVDQNRAGISNLSLDRQKLELDEAHLVERIQDEHGQEVLQAWKIESENLLALDEDVREELRDRLLKLKNRVAREGDVDPTSIEVLAVEEVRLADLQAQKDDLEIAARTLRRTIEKLTETSKQRFVSTFTAVQKNFAQLIPRLYGGGKGSIELLDPTHPLESGIDIIIRPPGKKLKSIELLSGGEKALGAIGLVFAMFLVRPSPLCVLDEVDAPLDEANLLRFINLVKELSSKTQFVMITHNKGSMSACDRLVGVTMPEPGASRVISVSLQEAYERVA